MSDFTKCALAMLIGLVALFAVLYDEGVLQVGYGNVKYHSCTLCEGD